MDIDYFPEKIEPTIQKKWKEKKTFHVNEQSGKEKFYCLSMFPYPSGALHVGHVRNYTLGDTIARYQRMQGKNVLQPIGWDAFGLPAEGAAIKHGIAPSVWTYQNIEDMKKQLQELGLSFDWSREFATCDPDYYQWEQWFFTYLYEKKLIYRKFSLVNWCPHDQTVLANEQVENGRCWRCDNLVERKELPQWFLKITAYADELLEGLEELQHWPEQVKIMQKKWIGKSQGVEVFFELENPQDDIKQFTIYTTRVDTLMGVTFLGLSYEHPLSQILAKNHQNIDHFIKESKKYAAVSDAERAHLEKEGIDTHLFAIHPITKDKIPIWITNFVLMEYGSGAVMAVPGHDQRDWEFAKKFHLPIKQVIAPLDQSEVNLDREAFTKKGYLINSSIFNDLQSHEAQEKIQDWLEAHKKGQSKICYRLRDWGISRQRYWGTPVPVLYLENDEIVTVPKEQLPVVLPQNIQLDGMSSPLVNNKEWQSTEYKGQKAIRETDTFDTFMESSWYYLRFCSPHTKQGMCDLKAAHYWLPVDQYIGGIEHACMHLLYARFFHKLLRDAGMVQSNEPFTKLLCQGMVLADTFYTMDKTGGKIWLSSDDVHKKKDSKGQYTDLSCKKTGEKVYYGKMAKMSKSKNNGVNPHHLIQKYGADTLRLYILFAAPPAQSIEWSDSGVEGAHRFLKRFWRMTVDHLNHKEILPLDKTKFTVAQKEVYQKIHATISKVSDDIERRQMFNTAIASIMELSNTLQRWKESSEYHVALERHALEVMILLLYPMTPHICEFLWEKMHPKKDIVDQAWPQYEKEALIQDTKLWIVQINGKMRARISLEASLTEEEVKNHLLNDPHVQKYLMKKEIKKMIFVPDKLMNIVIS